MGQRLDNLDKRIELLRRHFGQSVTPETFEAFMKANTPRQLDRAMQDLFEQGIQKVELSKEPFRGKIEGDAEFVDLKQLAKNGDSPS